MDLHRQFDTLAGPEVPPTREDVNSDLDRGRRALRRRRTLQKIAAATFAAAALAAGVTIATNTGAPAPTTPSAGRDPGSVSVPATRLVAYTGTQPKGYTIDKVPDGWEIQADTTHALILAPKNALDQDPQSFVGKIGIMLQSKDQDGPPKGRKVEVGAAAGVLVPEPEVDDTTRRLREEAKRAAITKGGPSAAPFLVDDGANDGATLWVEQPNGVYLLVQFWAGLGLSERDMLDIGAGVHVHKDAEQGVG